MRSDRDECFLRLYNRIAFDRRCSIQCKVKTRASVCKHGLCGYCEFINLSFMVSQKTRLIVYMVIILSRNVNLLLLTGSARILYILIFLVYFDDLLCGLVKLNHTIMKRKGEGREIKSQRKNTFIVSCSVVCSACAWACTCTAPSNLLKPPRLSNVNLIILLHSLLTFQSSSSTNAASAVIIICDL